MFYKLIFVLATLCVVNASVITADVVDDDSETGVADPKRCHPQACDQLCRRLRLPGGVCVRGRCKCDRALNAEVDDPETEVAVNSIENADLQRDDPETQSVDPRRCVPQECVETCLRLKFPGGACIRGLCKCARSLNAEDNVYEETLADLEDVVPLIDVLEGSLPVSELSEDQTERKCNFGACNQFCRRLKYAGGHCNIGHCRCYGRSFDTEDAVDEYSELDRGFRGCKLRRCNRSCVKRGYESGACVNGVCECNKKTPNDTFPLNDVTNDEQEDSNVILKSDEEELIVPSLRSCDVVQCNTMCHRLKFAGGMCLGGSCKCY